MRHLWIVGLLTIGCSDLDGDGAWDSVDCDATDPTSHPRATEVCDGRDNNCNGQVDEGVAFVAYWDRDLDGWGDAEFARRVCSLPADGSLAAGDCDDFDPTISPAADERCDLVDNNCDGTVDELLGTTFYRDADGDGHGDPSAPTSSGCVVPAGFAGVDDDCDDADSSVYPGAPELCDGADNNCDGATDEGLATTRVWEDVDGDGYGDPLAPTLGCGTRDGVADNDLDCDDLDPTRSPDALDVRGDDWDADCDGYVDEFGVGPLNEFETVDDALALAPDGSVIQLDAGFFVGTIDLRGRAVTFAGEGCERTTWYADGTGTAIRMDGGIVERMTISGGAGDVEAEGDQGVLHVGGGIAITGDATVRAACVSNNAAEAGGGIAVLGGTSTVEDVLLLRNHATVDGGGLYVAYPATADVTRSRLLANVAGRGGGLHARGGSATLRNVVIAANQATLNGSGVSGSAAGTDEASLILDQVTLHANKSVLETGADGQAVFLSGNIANDVHQVGVLHNVLITGHPRNFTMVGGVQGGSFTKSFVGYRANVGPDADFGVPQPDRIGTDVAYILEDPTIPPEQWDLRMRASSRAIHQGDPTVQDPDGSLSDLGAYGGPGAPDGWDYGLAVDEDGDGMLSGYEIYHGLNPWVQDQNEDPDGDTLPNVEEAAAGTHPWLVDTDEDGVDDPDEVVQMSVPYDARDQAPLADAGHDRYAMVGEPVWLDAGASADPNGDPLTFQWTLDQLPPFSAATLTNPAAERFAFVPDATGTYLLTVAVSDGKKTTRSARVAVYVFDGPIVPDDAATLADALASAQPGQAVGLRPGTWSAALDVGATKRVIVGLIGEGSAADVVLDGAGRGSVLRTASELTLAQVTLTGGYATTGGGLHVDTPDSDVATPITLADVVIRQNFAAEGAGLWVSGPSTMVVLDDVQILDNHATLQGGGVFVAGFHIPGTLTAVRTTFAGNSAPRGGALFSDGGVLYGSDVLASESSFLLYACTFAGNHADQGAVFHHGGAGSNLHIENATYVGNFGGSLGVAAEGRVTLLSDLLARNEVDVLWAGSVEIQHHQGVWHHVNPHAVWGEDVTGLQATAEGFVSWVDADPRLARYTDDGDPSDDLWAHLVGSAAIDAGFIDDVDRDGSRADVGACSGPHALARCQSFAFDADGDGMADGWEVAVGTDPHANDAELDPDADGLDTLAEMDAGTDPFDPDSDEDGVIDVLDDDPLDDRDHRPQLVTERFVVADPTGPTAISAAASYDPDGEPLSFQWRVDVAPPGSAATLTDVDTDTVTFTPDGSGTWALSVTATAGGVPSRPFRLWVHVGEVFELNVDGSGDFVTIDDALAAVTLGDRIVLGGGEWPIHLTGQSFPVEIAGAGMDETVLTPVDETSQVQVEPWDHLILRDLTLREGLAAVGGGIRCTRGTVELERVRLLRGVASRGGGAYLEDCTALFSEVEVLENQASIDGGGIAVLGGTFDWVGGIAAQNRATNGGGALDVASADVVVRNVVFTENETKFYGSAIGIEDDETRSGGVFSGDHLTFVNNRVFGLVPGAIGRRTSSPVAVRNSVFVGNAPYAVYDGAPDKVELTLDHNLYWDNTNDVFPVAQIGSDNLFDNPRLVGAGDYRLTRTSPARGWASDLNPDGSPGDLGAYGGPDASPGWDRFQVDLDGDGMADEWELAVGLDPALADGATDPDLDGIPNRDEHDRWTDPYQEDSDGDSISDGDEVVVGDDPTDPFDHAPKADAGDDLRLSEGEPAELWAVVSDPQGDPVSVRWELVAKPGRSQLSNEDLIGAETAALTFWPDVPGTYAIHAIGNDGVVDGPPDEVLVAVIGDILVPEDYPSVAAAVAAAPSGSTLYIGPGVWPTRVNLAGRDLTLIGVGTGDDGTFLDGEGLGSVLVANTFEEVTLQDLTVTGGRGGRGGGLWYASGARLTVERVSFEGNVAGEGGGLFTEGGFATVTVADSRFVDNVVGYRGGGLSSVTITNLTIDRTLIAGNRAPNDYGGGARIERGTTTLRNVIVSDNGARAGGGLAVTGLNPVKATVTLDHVTATYNSATDTGAFLEQFVYSDVTLTNAVVAYNDSVPAVDWVGVENTYTQTYSLFSENVLDYAAPTGTTVPSDGDADGNRMPYDPGLEDVTLDGDWTNETWWLSPTSAGVDAGDPSGPPDPDGSLPDMGAFGGANGDWLPIYQ